MQQNKLLISIIIIVAILGFGGSAYFFTASRSLSTQKTIVEQQLFSAEQNVDHLEGDKIELEKELVFYKNTDFAKDNELLRLKLQNTEKDLAGAQNRVKTLETNLNKIRPFIDAVSAIERFLNAPFTQKGLTDINTNISILQDTEVSNRWMTARNTVDFSNNGWGPHDFFQTVFLLNSRIRSLLP